VLANIGYHQHSRLVGAIRIIRPPAWASSLRVIDSDLLGRIILRSRRARPLADDASPEDVAEGLEVTTTPQVSRTDFCDVERAPTEAADGATGPSDVNIESTSPAPSVEAASTGQPGEEGLSQAAPATRPGKPRSVKPKPKKPVLRESKKPVARPVAAAAEASRSTPQLPKRSLPPNFCWTSCQILFRRYGNRLGWIDRV
jgi:hypothetical protein